MTLELTPCGHLKVDLRGNPQFCAKCKPASQKQADLAALQEQEAQDPKLVKVGNEMVALLQQWADRGENPKQIIGVIMGAAIGIAQQTDTPKQEVLDYLETLWP